MSYEFRTPLTSISGFADLLLAGIGGEMTDQSREYVGAIAISAERLSQQINTVLDYSQSEAGALPIARQPVDIADMLARCVDKLTAANADNSKNLNIEIAKEVGLVTGDNFRLQQAIGQILDNAVRHGGPGVAIDLRAKGSASIVEISVQDNGPGIADEVPLEASVQQKGLGLALAKQLIESHGGKIEIKSLKDRGTTVRITLPRA
jgi:signal transduction histidine kinase